MSHKNIVCAIDGTEDAHEVVRAAKSVATQSGAKITLMTVIKPIAHTYGGLDLAVLGQDGISFEEEAVRKAREWLDKLDEDYDLGCEKIAIIGAPAHEIRARAEETEADLIVIGSHGRHGIGRLLGSTANGVLHGVPCDVLVIRIKDEEE